MGVEKLPNAIFIVEKRGGGGGNVPRVGEILSRNDPKQYLRSGRITETAYRMRAIILFNDGTTGRNKHPLWYTRYFGNYYLMSSTIVRSMLAIINGACTSSLDFNIIVGLKTPIYFD